MVFSSQIFFFYFLPIVLVFYYLSPKKLKHLTLTLFSYIFYSFANPLFGFLMFGTTVVNYYCGLVIANNSFVKFTGPSLLLGEKATKTKTQKIALGLSIICSLSVLGFFKYFNFLLDSYNELLGVIGSTDLQWDNFLRITLPLGISFYTFQAMSYVIDVYRGHGKAMKHFIDFACYVAMFPQLVAGPIIRFREIEQQLQSRTFSFEKFSRGVAFISFGLAKKIIIANGCGKIADMCFNASGIHTLDAWVGAFAYSFQIYFDFSAYSDMAIGLGLMLGFMFPKNFDSPYLSASITEFWRRWHISLSTWLRDYLYFPLGGNKNGLKRTYVNLALVMLLGGLWHGASWNFIIWGGIHGLFLIFERLQGKDSIYRNLPRAARIAITFLIVTFAWVFFRAPDIQSAFSYLSSMFSISETNFATYIIESVIYTPYAILMLIVAAIFVWFAPQTWDFTKALSFKKALLTLTVLMVSFALMSSQSFNPFIYFIF